MNYDKLKGIYLEKGIQYCEARLDDCMINFGLSFHHRHKRIWYKMKPERKKLLTDFNHTIIVCAKCHSTLEWNRKKHRELFNKLRKI